VALIPYPFASSGAGRLGTRFHNSVKDTFPYFRYCSKLPTGLFFVLRWIFRAVKKALHNGADY
jgi:hypothetical protein